MQSLQQKIDDRTAVVGVMGLGYVGLPLAAAFAAAGFRTIGFDVDPKKVEALGKSESYLRHLGETFVTDLTGTGRFEATADFDRLGEPDAVFVCVPTPLGKHLEPHLDYVADSTDAIAACLRKGQLIVLESTTYPRTTREEVVPRLEATGLACGTDFFVAYSPEREDPGRKDFTTQRIPKLVGGIDDAGGDLAESIYRAAFEQVVRVSSAEIAESAKLMENIYRAVNIALVNEMKTILTAMDIDVWEVIEAASTKPFGFQAFYPGPGLGGHCIPIDPYYLTWKAREYGHSTLFIELAGQINHAMPDFVIARTMWALNERSKSVKGSKILVLGLAYKPDVDDTRESPSFEIIESLQDLGADVAYHDPHVPVAPRRRRFDLKLDSVELTPEILAEQDCVVIATDHSCYDWAMVAEHAPLLVDTRGATRHLEGDLPNVVRA